MSVGPRPRPCCRRTATCKRYPRLDRSLSTTCSIHYADAALRILEVYQAHPAYVATGRFTLAAGKHVNAAQLARLVEAAHHC